MAVILYCDKCDAKIKILNPGESTPDKTVCKQCVDVAYSFRDELTKEYKKLNQQLANTYNKATVALEEIIHRALDE